eukprot:11099373-Lingulodinium_polyedra.AAC.1
MNGGAKRARVILSSLWNQAQAIWSCMTGCVAPISIGLRASWSAARSSMAWNSRARQRARQAL